MPYVQLELTVLQPSFLPAITPAAVSSTTAVVGTVSKAAVGKAITTASISATTVITFHPPDVYSTTTVSASIRKPGFQQIVPAAIFSTTVVIGAISVVAASTGGYQSQRTDGFAHLMGFPL